MYIPFIWNDIEGDWFGYGWASSFLWSLGNELTPILFGALLWYLSSIVNVQFQDAVKNISKALFAIGFFFGSWVFYDGNFTKPVEIAFSVATSLVMVFITVKFLNTTNSYVSHLKGKIRSLMNIIIVQAPNHVNDLQVWDVEIVEPSIRMLNEK